MPKLSVLMPAHNAERTVGSAVRSTLRAMPRDSELVVLDDGSTDGTAEILRRFEGPRLRLIRRPNGGVASALNELVAATDSDLIARMDADDLVLPGRFARQLRAIRSGLDGVFTTVVSWGSGAPGLPRPIIIGPDSFRFHLLLTNPVTHSTFLGTRSAIESLGGYRQLPAEDYDLWLRMAAHRMRLSRLSAPGLAYRLHPHQVTASSQWRRSSWHDPMIGDAYARLAEQLIGARARRITTLSADPELSPSEKIDTFDAFASSFTAAIAGLEVEEQRRLRRRLRERRDWLTAAVRETRREAGVVDA